MAEHNPVPERTEGCREEVYRLWTCKNETDRMKGKFTHQKRSCGKGTLGRLLRGKKWCVLTPRGEAGGL